MKKLRIPDSSNDFVDLGVITKDFKGLIIGYKDNTAVCYIQYDDEYWYSCIDISTESGRNESNSPFELIQTLIRTNKCNNFKVLEFNV